jgi:hypothetical protein
MFACYRFKLDPLYSKSQLVFATLQSVHPVHHQIEQYLLHLARSTPVPYAFDHIANAV